MGVRRFLGRKAKLYYNSGTYESPTWAGITTRDTLSVDRSRTSEDVTGEDSAGEQWEQTILNSRALNFEAFQAEDDTDNTVCLALIAAEEAGTPMEFAVAMGDITTVGVRVRRYPDMELHEAGEGFDVKGVSKVKVVAKPGPSENAPSTFVVSE